MAVAVVAFSRTACNGDDNAATESGGLFRRLIIVSTGTSGTSGPDSPRSQDSSTPGDSDAAVGDRTDVCLTGQMKVEAVDNSTDSDSGVVTVSLGVTEIVGGGPGAGPPLRDGHTKLATFCAATK